MQIARGIRYGFIALAANFVNVAPASEVAAAPIMNTQAPCTARPCIRITTQNAGSAPHTLRSIVFQPPGAGKAWVQFNGTGFCTMNFIGGSRGWVNFETQIVPTNSASPVATSPGGNIYRFTMEETKGSSPNGTHAFNLSSNRVFPITSTTAQTYYFKLIFRPFGSFSSIGSSIVGDFYNLSFSILFMP